MRTLFYLICFTIILLGVDDFESFKANQLNEYADFSNEFAKYKKAYDEAFTAYKREIEKNFDTPDITTNYIWVEYDRSFRTKKLVDFKNGNIALEVIATNEFEAKQKFQKLFDELLNQTTKKAYQNDILEQTIQKKIGHKPKVTNAQPIVADIFTKQQAQDFKKNLEQSKPFMVVHNDNKIFKLNIKMPPDYLLKKAASYKQVVALQSEKNNIPQNLIFAIIHTESSFNPMARSRTPAYGLMQIVPHSAGIDINKFLYNNATPPTSDFLYDSHNNILFGTTLLNILNTKYLATISDPLSRLYCVICAYNTGVGNVARAFIGNNNIKVATHTINALSSEMVYQHLLKNLPYSETRDYLVHVHERLEIYSKFVEAHQ